jgi:hypothetical protein
VSRQLVRSGLTKRPMSADLLLNDKLQKPFRQNGAVRSASEAHRSVIFSLWVFTDNTTTGSLFYCDCRQIKTFFAYHTGFTNLSLLEVHPLPTRHMNFYVSPSNGCFKDYTFLTCCSEALNFKRGSPSSRPGLN